MRKALIAVIVASALFAVGAFAASFAVESEDIASGSNAVDDCAQNVDVDFVTNYYAADDDWRVVSADITFFDDAATPAAVNTCEGYGLSLILEDAAGNVISTTEDVVGSGFGPHNLAITDLLAQPLHPDDIWHAAVLVDGVTLNVPSTGEGLTFVNP